MISNFVLLVLKKALILNTLQLNWMIMR